ncbi:uncharacterized protein DUF4328 [Agrobacterium vitis]|nr:uncharacterized protein DUF4328 [Agrobacterium vitis]
MQLDALLTQLMWLRRGWLFCAVITGALYMLLVPFYLYTAWVQYVVEATGAAISTGVNGWLVQIMASWAGPMDSGIVVFQVLGLVLWFGWLWLSCRFVALLGHGEKMRFGAFSITVLWFAPVLNLLFVPFGLMEIANATTKDPQSLADAEPDRDIPVLAWGIGILNLLSDGLFFYLANTSASAFAGEISGQNLMHIAAVSGIVTLLLLLAMDAYIRRIAEAQETRAARLHLH